MLCAVLSAAECVRSQRDGAAEVKSRMRAVVVDVVVVVVVVDVIDDAVLNDMADGIDIDADVIVIVDDILNDVVDIDVDADVIVDIDRYIFVMLFPVNAVLCINSVFANMYTKIKLMSILSPFFILFNYNLAVCINIVLPFSVA